MIRTNIPQRFLLWNICKQSTLLLQPSPKIDGKIFKKLWFSRNFLKHLLIEFQGNSHYICLASLLESGILQFSPLRYEWNKLPLKNFKTTMPRLPWLIWAAYNPFLKYQKKWWNLGQETRGRIKFNWPFVLHLVLYLVFWYFRKCKTRDRVKFYAAAGLGSWYIVIFSISVRNDLNRKSAAAYFHLSLQYNYFQTTWLRTKFQWLFPLKASLKFLSDKLILSCSIRRC